MLLLAAAPAGARAETAVLMPAVSDSGLASEAVTAHAAVARALEAQGVTLVSHAAAVERAGGGALADCRALSCSGRLAQEARADLAVTIAVRAGDDGPVVSVVLSDAQQARFTGKASVELSDVGAAARRALLEARAYQLLGPGPHLRVRSQPSEAELWIDGARAGATPYRAAIASGRHTIELRVAGYKTHAQMVDVPRQAEEALELDFVLEPRAGGQGQLDQDLDQDRGVDNDIELAELRAPSRSRPVVGPVLLGLLGLSAIAYDVVAIARAGCQRREPTGACTHDADLNLPIVVAFGGVGVAALTAGVLWFVLGAEDDAQPGASARITPLSAELRVRF